jgi:hypothetical protein
MQVKDSDIKNAENLMKLLNKTKVELEGLEIAAAGAAFMWFIGHLNAMKEEFNKPPIRVVEEKEKALKEPIKTKLKKVSE